MRTLVWGFSLISSGIYAQDSNLAPPTELLSNVQTISGVWPDQDGYWPIGWLPYQLSGLYFIVDAFKDEYWTKFSNHGCYCPRLFGDPSTSAAYEGCSSVDSLDQMCKNWLHDRKCHTLNGGSCSDRATGVKQATYTVTDFSTGFADSSDCSAAEECDLALCRIDMKNSALIIDYFYNSYIVPSEVFTESACPAVSQGDCIAVNTPPTHCCVTSLKSYKAEDNYVCPLATDPNAAVDCMEDAQFSNPTCWDEMNGGISHTDPNNLDAFRTFSNGCFADHLNICLEVHTGTSDQCADGYTKNRDILYSTNLRPTCLVMKQRTAADIGNFGAALKLDSTVPFGVTDDPWPAELTPESGNVVEMLNADVSTEYDSAAQNDDPTPSRRKRDTPPLSFDLRDHVVCGDYINHVRSQGNCGTCWAFAATSIIADGMCMQVDDQELLSPMQLAICCPTCLSDATKVCKGGSANNAIDYFIEKGLVSGSDYNSDVIEGYGKGCYPYEFGGSSTAHFTSNANSAALCRTECDAGTGKTFEKDRRGNDAQIAQKRIAVNTDENRNDAKRWIMSKGSMFLWLEVYEDFMNYRGANAGIYEHSTTYSGEKIGNHFLRVIGWGTEGGKDYWLFLNSWGKTWGIDNDGYGKIRMGTNTASCERYSFTGVVWNCPTGQSPGSDGKCHKSMTVTDVQANGNAVSYSETDTFVDNMLALKSYSLASFKIIPDSWHAANTLFVSFPVYMTGAALTGPMTGISATYSRDVFIDGRICVWAYSGVYSGYNGDIDTIYPANGWQTLRGVDGEKLEIALGATTVPTVVVCKALYSIDKTNTIEFPDMNFKTGALGFTGGMVIQEGTGQFGFRVTEYISYKYNSSETGTAPVDFEQVRLELGGRSFKNMQSYKFDTIPATLNKPGTWAIRQDIYQDNYVNPKLTFQNLRYGGKICLWALGDYQGNLPTVGGSDPNWTKVNESFSMKFGTDTTSSSLNLWCLDGDVVLKAEYDDGVVEFGALDSTRFVGGWIFQEGNRWN